MNADPRLEENVRLCSLMFAYVRLCSLYWRKMFEASDCERGSIRQNARPTEMGTRETRPSKYQRQRLARTKLDLGRARCLRANAKRMKGKAKGLNDRNTCFIYDTDARGSGLRENLRLSSLILAYSRLQRSPQDRRQGHGEQAALRLLPLPARNERGEGRGEGKALKTLSENDLVFPGHPSP
jgi:hypothetical protein